MGTQPSLQKGGGAPIFGPCLLWPNGWMDQDATWYGGRPRPWPHCVRWGLLPPKRGHSRSHFLAHVLWPNGWMDQNATWYGGRPRPWQHCVRWGLLPPKGHTPNFRPMSVVAKRLDGSRIMMSLGREVAASAQATLCYPAPLKRGTASRPPL